MSPSCRATHQLHSGPKDTLRNTNIPLSTYIYQPCPSEHGPIEKGRTCKPPYCHPPREDGSFAQGHHTPAELTHWKADGSQKRLGKRNNVKIQKQHKMPVSNAAGNLPKKTSPWSHESQGDRAILPKWYGK